jgi:co-chaperonin GroES (HSP10)
MEKSASTSLSFIEPYEEQEAKNLISKELGFDPPKPAGYHMLIKLYIRPEELKKIKREDGTEATIYLGDAQRMEDQYRTCVALVIAQGPECYQETETKKFPQGPWCRVGDWVVFPRHEGTRFVYKGVPMFFIPDDRIFGTVFDPQDVVRD